MAPAIPTVAALEPLLAVINRKSMGWTEHILLVEAEKSTNLSSGPEDPAMSMSEGLMELARKAKILDWRLQALEAAFPKDDDDEELESYCTVNKLLSLIDKPRSCETASTVLRRAAMRLTAEVRRTSRELVRAENSFLNDLNEFADVAERLLKCERIRSTFDMIAQIQAAQKQRELLAREPEDAVWTRELRDIVCSGDKRLQRKNFEKRVFEQEWIWRLVLMRATQFNMRVGSRQTLIHEFFSCLDGG